MLRYRKYVFISIPVILIFLGIGYYYSIYNSVKEWNDKIFPKTIINNINMTGKKTTEAEEILKDSVSYIDNKVINVKYGDKVYKLEYKDLRPQYNVKEIIKEVYNYGRDLGLFEKAKFIKSSQERRYSTHLSYDTKPVDEFVNKLEAEINREPVNASIRVINGEKIDITKGIKGVKIKKENLKQNILSKINEEKVDNTEVVVEIEETNPELPTEMLKQINTLVSSYSTNYGGSPAGRAANVELAAKQINGALVLPGATFSFNSTTGKRDVSKGYQAAPVIINNKLVDGLGGGVCQVSTTLYNAIIRMNLKSTERANHTLTLTYVEPGFDATVSDDIDYKFKNTLPYPIYIEGLTKEGRVYFNVYSNSELANTKYELISEVYEKTPAKTVYIDDPALPKGTKQKLESAHMGCKVKVYLIGKKNGNEISRELITKDTYQKMDEIIKVGTKSSI